MFRVREKRPGLRWMLIPAAVLALGLLLGACGDDTGTDGIASVNGSNEAADSNVSEPGDGDSEQALLDFTECMREQGVDVDDPEMDSEGNLRLTPPGGMGRDSDQFREALEACEEHLDDADLGFDRGDQSEMQDALVEFAQCMRDEGIDMPDPDFSGGGARFDPGVIDPDDPDFQKAQEQCEHLLGEAFRGGRDQ